MSSKNKLIFYGAVWCPDCRRSKQFLDEKGIDYEYINIEEVPGAAEEVERINKGMQSIPTILFPDGQILVEPSNAELEKALDANKKYIIVHKNIKKGG
ncbi:MAG: glutathione S-transferase N-terminal domain-containing protein [Candidatus Levybacteria bacterium]|nr:glutathione S-transferase N-terminal domain-containing protein [Candidatus Levybacteria bacterium]